MTATSTGVQSPVPRLRRLTVGLPRLCTRLLSRYHGRRCDGQTPGVADRRPPLGPPLNTGGEVRLVIVGKGELAEQYKKLAQELGFVDRVTFAGGVSDEELVKLYQTSAVTVLPSIDQSESFGIVLAESIACGTPVITSNLPGVRSVYEDGVSGITVPVRDEQGLANAINMMLANPLKRAAMGKAARRLCEKRYTWDSIGTQLLALCGAQ